MPYGKKGYDHFQNPKGGDVMTSSQTTQSPAGLVARSLIFALLSLGLSFSTQAQTTDDDEAIEEIVVTGFKGSLRM